MNQYKIIIEDRNCEEWTISNTVSLMDVTLEDFNPLSHKLFNGDIFTYDGTEFKLIHSCTKTMNYFSGVLILEKNKSYGKYKDKHLYKCLPDDRRIPSFLIPYEIKNIGFSISSHARQLGNIQKSSFGRDAKTPCKNVHLRLIWDSFI